MPIGSNPGSERLRLLVIAPYGLAAGSCPCKRQPCPRATAPTSCSPSRGRLRLLAVAPYKGSWQQPVAYVGAWP
ncbi:hypothetical protein B296_00023886 [Ensete ventricosum]|uniref:Uncharacterized protein n=1 Tax=Ensete ventricosum TaxID=4639 RepID=A0A426ZPM5_ENSVE|nr:hypothetical protein B296_00023886 [Ensete ventricosum]